MHLKSRTSCDLLETDSYPDAIQGQFVKCIFYLFIIRIWIYFQNFIIALLSFLVKQNLNLTFKILCIFYVFFILLNNFLDISINFRSNLKQTKFDIYKNFLLVCRYNHRRYINIVSIFIGVNLFIQ